MKNEENKTNKYVTKINYDDTTNGEHDNVSDKVVVDSPCPCCEFMTIPKNGDALAYICPVCFWEMDLFIQSDVEASDQNHGLTLIEARKNYQSYGAVLPMLKKFCRQPKEYEYPTK